MLEKIKALVEFVQIQGPILVAAIMAILTAAEAIVRLTPTKTDDTAVERVGTMIRKMFDALGVPNVKKGGGEHLDSNETVVVPKTAESIEVSKEA